MRFVIPLSGPVGLFKFDELRMIFVVKQRLHIFGHQLIGTRCRILKPQMKLLTQAGPYRMNHRGEIKGLA